MQRFDLEGMRVLVVEDDPASKTLLSHILAKHGADVHTASNGQEGLSQFEKNSFPLVVTDICMPDIDGIEMASRIRDIDRNAQIIAISAKRETNYLLSAIELGFSDYLLKPLEVDKFLLAVNHCRTIIAAREQLEDERAKFRNVVESISECLAIKTLDMRITYQNPAMTTMFGDRTGAPCYSIWNRSDPCPDCPTDRTISDGRPHGTCRTYHTERGTMTMETNVSLLKDSHGTVTGTIEILRDISERARVERLIHNIARGVSAKVGADFLDSLANFLTEELEMDFALVGIVQQETGRVETLAFSCRGNTGEPFSYDLKGTPCEQVLKRGVLVFQQGVASQFPDDADLRNLSIESYCGAPLTDSHGEPVGVLCVFHRKPITRVKLVKDIITIFASRAGAELERLKNELFVRQLAFHDPLTGLANRRLFEDRLEQAIASSRRYGMKFALLTLDLDHFKEINDTLGHEAGDRVLVETGRRISACCKRDLDTISRKGGDEFCILVTGCNDQQQLEVVIARLLEEIARPIMFNGQAIELTASIGVSLFPDAGDDAKQLEIASDRAMYAAKKAGRNTSRFWNIESAD